MTVYQMEVLHRNIKREHRHRSTVVYSIHASDSFNLRLHGIMRDFSRDLANQLGDELIGIVMGGSYGRGEASFCRTCGTMGSGIWSGGQAPLDAIKLLLVVRNHRPNSQRYDSVLAKYAAIIGVPISVPACVTIDQLNHSSPRFSMFEWAVSHQVIYGPEYILDGLRSIFGFIGDMPGAMAFGKSEADSELYQLGAWILQTKPIREKSGLTPLAKQNLAANYHYCILKLVDIILLGLGQWDNQARLRKDAFSQAVSTHPWFTQNHDFATQFFQRYREILGSSALDFCIEDDDECLKLWSETQFFWISVQAFLRSLDGKRQSQQRLAQRMLMDILIRRKDLGRQAALWRLGVWLVARDADHY